MQKTLLLAIAALALAGCHQKQTSILDGDGDSYVSNPAKGSRGASGTDSSDPCPGCDASDDESDSDDEGADCGKPGHGKGKGHFKGRGKGHLKHDHSCLNANG